MSQEASKPLQMKDLICWRCRKENIWYEMEVLEDGAKLPFYACYSCGSKFYDISDIMPYIMRLKLQLRNQWVKPTEEAKATGESLPMRATRPP